MNERSIARRVACAPAFLRPACRAAFLALALLAAGSTSASVTLTGRVTDDRGVPLAETRVQILGSRHATATGADGSFRLAGLPAGRVTLFVSRPDYNPVTRDLSLPQDGSLAVDVALRQAVLELERLVTTGTARETDLLRVTGAIDVIAGRDKLRRETASLGGTLEGLAGVSNLSTGSQNGKPVIRGLWGNRIRILKDDVGVNHQQWSFRHAPNIEPLLAERIEVVRGATSVLYGSDAIGGAVNVIPYQVPSAAPGATILDAALTGHYAGVNNERTAAGRFNGAVGGFGLTAAVVDRRGNNLQVPDEPTFPETGIPRQPNFSGELDHTDFDQTNAELAVGYSGARGSVELRWDQWETEQNFLLPPPVNLPSGTGIGVRLENDSLIGSGVLEVSPRWSVHARLAEIDNLRQANPGGLTREFLPEAVEIDLLRETQTVRLEARHLELGPGFTGRLGVEWVNEDQFSRGSVGLTPGAEIENIALFAFERFETGPWTFEAGMRYDEREQTALLERTFDDSVVPDDPALRRQRYDALTGTVGVNYRVTDDLALVANVARGFRAPTLFELHVNGVHGGVAAFQRGDPTLTEEQSLGVDIGIRWRTDRIELAANAYRMAIDDYIFLGDTGELTSGGLPILQSDQDDGELTGFDLTVNAALTDRLKLRATLETVDGEFTSTGEALPLLPADQVQLEGRYEFGTLGPLRQAYALLGVRYAADQETAGLREPFSQFDTIPFGTASTDAYTLVDLGFGFDLPTVHGFRATVDLGVQNVFDEAYRDFLDTYKAYALSPGRNVWLRTTIPFGN